MRVPWNQIACHFVLTVSLSSPSGHRCGTPSRLSATTPICATLDRNVAQTIRPGRDSSSKTSIRASTAAVSRSSGSQASLWTCGPTCCARAMTSSPAALLWRNESDRRMAPRADAAAFERSLAWHVHPAASPAAIFMRSRPGPTGSAPGVRNSCSSATPARTSLSSIDEGRDILGELKAGDAADRRTVARACARSSTATADAERSAQRGSRHDRDLSPSRAPISRRSIPLPLVADRPRARAGAWYEMVPRSQGSVPGRHGTFDDCIARLAGNRRAWIRRALFHPDPSDRPN